MITANSERIAALTAAGSWGSDTLHRLLARNAKSRPCGLAIKDQPNREQLTGDPPVQLNWAELDIASENLALRFQDQGVGEDDRVIVQLPNVAELLVRASMFPRPPAGALIETKVADAQSGDELTAQGERGELLIAGPTVFDGNFYRIVGRCKDIINRGGMKISPAELDVALEEHPDIVDAAVCAYPDERLGEKICACVVMKPGVATLELEALQSLLLEAGFAKFKLPERVKAFDQIPRNAMGKVQRFMLEELENTQTNEKQEP